MTTFLDEVPGARERPGGCPIRVAREDDGALTLTVPARGVSPVVLFFACVLLGNLLVTLYTGLTLALTHRSVLFLAQISPGGLPYSLRGWEWALVAGLLLAESLGFLALWAILRPLSVREVIRLDGDGVSVRHSEWGRVRERRLPRADVRGFVLRRDPQGLKASTLTVRGRGEAVEIGEYLREADREWLASVGNALLGA